MIVHGAPSELAQWAHDALRKRNHGVRYALILNSKLSASLVDMQTKKFDRIEKEKPETIVGCYVGCLNRPIRIEVEDIREAIHAALKDMVGKTIADDIRETAG